MKFIAVVLFIFLLTPTVVSAANNYIKIGVTSSTKQLHIVQYRVSKLGLREIHRVKNHRYIIYSGPYRSKNSTLYAFKKIKRYFPNATIIFQSAKKQKSKNKRVQKADSLPFFIGVGMSYSSAPSSHIIESGTVAINKPKNSGLSYGVDAGYNFYDNFFIGLGYLKFDTDDLVFNNIYGILNYKFSPFKEKFTPYFEVVAGYSTLKWNIDPITNASSDSNNDSTSPFLGTQAGILYSLSQHISLFSEYQCMFMTHTTNLTVDSKNRSKIEHTTLHSLQIGLQYNF